jgi:hypothetical protein
MTSNNFSTATTGWIAIATGISAILSIIFLILMYTVNPSFGRVNDVFNSIIGISSLVLAGMLYAEHHAKSPLVSQFALALAVVGAVFMHFYTVRRCLTTWSFSGSSWELSC